MKVLCSSCEAAEASVLCCADDAALCARCDREVHAANRLAGKHQRLPLLAPGGAPAAAIAPPQCDICQECDAYFFCLEDRALLCQSCDVAVHTANDLVSAHRRFLLTGVQVGQEEQGSDDSGRSTEQPGPFGQEGGFGWAAALDAAGSLPEWSLAVSERLELGSPDPRHEAASKRSPAGSWTGRWVSSSAASATSATASASARAATQRPIAGSSAAARAAPLTTGRRQRIATPTSSSARCRRCSGRSRSSPRRRQPRVSTAGSTARPATAPPSCRTSAPRTPPLGGSWPLPSTSAGRNANEEKAQEDAIAMLSSPASESGRGRVLCESETAPQL